MDSSHRLTRLDAGKSQARNSKSETNPKCEGSKQTRVRQTNPICPGRGDPGKFEARNPKGRRWSENEHRNDKQSQFVRAGKSAGTACPTRCSAERRGGGYQTNPISAFSAEKPGSIGKTKPIPPGPGGSGKSKIRSSKSETNSKCEGSKQARARQTNPICPCRELRGDPGFCAFGWRRQRPRLTNHPQVLRT